MNKNTKKDFIYSGRPEKSAISKKQNKPKKNKTAMIILWLLFAFWTLSSVLSVFVFTKQVVKADTVTQLYTFEGSNITVWGSAANFYLCSDTVAVSNDSYTFANAEPYPFDSDLHLSNLYPMVQSTNSLVNYKFTLSDIQWDLDDGRSYATEMIVNTAYIQYDSAPLVANGYVNTYNAETLEDGNTRIILGGDYLENYYVIYSPNRNLNAQYLRVKRSSFLFNCNIYKVELGNYEDELKSSLQVNSLNGQTVYTAGSYTYNFNYIRYYDVNDNYLEISVPVIASNSYKPQAFFSNRTYFLTSNLSNNAIYTIAQREGYNSGYRAGLLDGKAISYDKGYQAGYDSGYINGLASTEQYSFLNLMGAVVDAPVRALFGWVDGSGQVVNGLLNFNVLGVNIANLVAGLLTIGLVVAILRICMGKS